MESRFNQATCDVLKLFPCLNEQVTAFWDSDRYTFSSISSPYVEARVTRSTMNCQKVEIGMETGQDGIFFAVFHKI